ncbi:SGNH/GDSL hydrolase family protein [Staphylospora marina]|uniref:SGNH/GDSL hydrolase family protein n=1 Tax=Staphylospora marina TaxID=2490858 RepID=UPI000F5BEEAE|nr:GDSL-type esterase/lipase family protein [Staphylospora marina]
MRDEQLRPVAYLALGDSLTEGIGAESPDRHFVVRLFRKLRHSDDCRFRNWGVSGMTSAELLHFVENPAILRMLPKMTHISLTTGGCDFIRLYEAGTLTLRDVVKTAREIQQRLCRILSLIRGANPTVSIYLLGFYLPPPAYELGFQKAAMAVKMMNRMYTRICERYGVTFINPFYRFLNRHEWFCDEVHPNQRGHDEISELFLSGANVQETWEGTREHTAGSTPVPSVNLSG